MYHFVDFFVALKTPLLGNKTISFMIFAEFQGKYGKTEFEFLEKWHVYVQSRHFCFIKKNPDKLFRPHVQVCFYTEMGYFPR